MSITESGPFYPAPGKLGPKTPDTIFHRSVKPDQVPVLPLVTENGEVLSLPPHFSDQLIETCRFARGTHGLGPLRIGITLSTKDIDGDPTPFRVSLNLEQTRGNDATLQRHTRLLGDLRAKYEMASKSGIPAYNRTTIQGQIRATTDQIYQDLGLTTISLSEDTKDVVVTHRGKKKPIANETRFTNTHPRTRVSSPHALKHKKPTRLTLVSGLIASGLIVPGLVHARDQIGQIAPVILPSSSFTYDEARNTLLEAAITNPMADSLSVSRIESVKTPSFSAGEKGYVSAEQRSLRAEYQQQLEETKASRTLPISTEAAVDPNKVVRTLYYPRIQEKFGVEDRSWTSGEKAAFAADYQLAKGIVAGMFGAQAVVPRALSAGRDTPLNIIKDPASWGFNNQGRWGLAMFVPFEEYRSNFVSQRGVIHELGHAWGVLPSISDPKYNLLTEYMAVTMERVLASRTGENPYQYFYHDPNNYSVYGSNVGFNIRKEQFATYDLNTKVDYASLGLYYLYENHPGVFLAIRNGWLREFPTSATVPLNRFLAWGQSAWSSPANQYEKEMGFSGFKGFWQNIPFFP
jgi:hypothetical protein